MLILTIASLAAGVAALGFAALMYWRPPKRTRLAYQTAEDRYFEQRDYALPSQAAMTFDGRKVERLRKATIVLWNAGTEVLRGPDIVAADPIRLSIDSGRILSHKVVKTTDPANDFRLAANAEDDVSHELTIYYDYLNPNDGAVVELMHDGTGATVLGKARGLKSGPENRGGIVPAKAAFARYYRSMSLSLGVAIVTLSIFWLLRLLGELLTSDVILFFLTGLVAPAAVLDVASIWRGRRQHPKALSP